MVKYIDAADSSEATYPGRLLGFFKYQNVPFADNKDIYAVVQSSMSPLSMEKLQSEFIAPFQLGSDPEFDYSVIPISSISHPLYVFKDYGGIVTDYFCVLPKRKWGLYFGAKIRAGSSEWRS